MDTATITTRDATPATVMLGHYQLRARLGEGGCGQVYEAWDERLQRAVALKRITQAGLSPDALLREARAAASLSHPAFVRIYDAGGQDGAPCIVMELVRGQTLRQHLAEHGGSPELAIHVVRQAAEAMAHAHAAGLVHGDLKPANLMIEQGGAVRILDFGLARHIDPQATATTADFDDCGAPGTIAYMAPERLAGKPSSAASDIYALGVVLHELAAGARPFAGLQGLALAAALTQTTSDMWPAPPGTSAGLLALIRDMTRRDPAARPHTMQQVCARLHQLQAGATPAGPPAAGGRWRGLAARLWRRGGAASRAALPSAVPGRYRRGAALGAGMAAAILAAAGLAAWRLHDGSAGAPAPYSELAAMRNGMAALNFSDRDGSLDDAVAAFKIVLGHNRCSAAANAALSLVYSARYSGDGRDPAWLALARAAAQQALQCDDQLALAHAAAGDVARLEGDGALAQSRYAEALRLDPASPQALAGQGNLLLVQRRYAEAETAIRAAQARWPRERRFADQLGTLYFRKNDYVRAEQAFRHSLQLEPDAVYAYANLSAALLSQGRDDEALQILQQGLQLRPSGRLYTNLGTTLFARGDYAGAARAFEHAVSGARGSPGDYLKWANLADALRWLPGRRDDAQQAYRRAIAQLAPQAAQPGTEPVLLSRMGLYLAHVGDPAAPDWAERALRRNPSSADMQFRAAITYELAGQRGAALACLARARALGYSARLIDSEPELIALRRDPRYHP